jgi:hypothetical protein
MSGPEPGFAYAQARLQARYGSRPSAADWSHVAATADLGALLQVLRNSRLARWTARMGQRPGRHEVERRLREEWLRAVDEVAEWHPEPWRPAIRWLRWIVYLPSLQMLARGGRAPAWARGDAVLGPVVAGGPAERAASLRRTALAPLAGPATTGSGMGAHWATHWRRLWPARSASRTLLEALLREVGHLGDDLAMADSAGRADDALATFERHMVLAFRRNPITPAASVAWLALLALDVRRLRGGLATRALREDAVSP